MKTRQKNKHNNIFSVEGKVIVVTGGAGYLGSEYVRALSHAGAHVIVWDKKDGMDITNEKEVQQAVKNIVKKYGRIDGLINNAAMNAKSDSPEARGQFVPYEDYPIDLWEKELKVNLTGTMICTKVVAPVMMKQKSGSIVNVASELSVIAHDRRIYNDRTDTKFKSIAYTTTKSALLGFSRQWAARLGTYGVRVNTFSPSGVEKKNQKKDFILRYSATTMLNRMAKLDEYNGVLIFLCSDASRFMTGHNLVVDGGRTAW